MINNSWKSVVSLAKIYAAHVRIKMLTSEMQKEHFQVRKRKKYKRKMGKLRRTNAKGQQAYY